MRRYLKPLLVMGIMLLLGYAMWPFIEANLLQLKVWFIQFRQFCRTNPYTGYVVYAGILSSILLVGLPLATVAMLLAGIIYNFWEAAALITVCRLTAAVAAFEITRHWMEAPRRYARRSPYWLKKFEQHPSLALFFARLAPIPDSMVNYTMGASTIRSSHYVLVSLLGMIPFTIFCVWLGNQLGSISKLIKYLN